ncbi:hypothetical protein ABZ858_36955 [Streptomyces sp. NPDC047017]|uniref:hypothetical protein n=1 Tax=Streptomyces sp. NPDC047017 TaxID=3155024 RepID=UPI0033EA0DDC
MGEGERETWTTEEFGSSHVGAVGVLLADGTVPDPVLFLSFSGAEGRRVSQWSVYDGRPHGGPRAAALRAVCSCGWTGSGRALVWSEGNESEGESDDPGEAAEAVADACNRDWDAHIVEVARSAVPLPGAVTALLEQLGQEIEKLAEDSPLAAVRAARHLEILAAQSAYWPARDIARDTSPEEAAAALGLNARDARGHLARLGGFSRY